MEPCYVSNNAPTAESVFSATSGWPLAVSRRIFARVLAVPVSMGAVAATAVLARPNDAVPLENRIRRVTCRSSVRQAARTYSLSRPLRMDFRRICHVSTSVTVAG